MSFIQNDGKWEVLKLGKRKLCSQAAFDSTFEHFHFQHLHHGSCVWNQISIFKNLNVRKKTEWEKFQIETTEAFLRAAASSFSSGIHSPVRQTWDLCCMPSPWKLPPFSAPFCAPVLGLFVHRFLGLFWSYLGGGLVLKHPFSLLCRDYAVCWGVWLVVEHLFQGCEGVVN